MKLNLFNKAAAIAICISVFSPLTQANAAGYTGWKTDNGKSYWYENGVKQGCPGDPKNIWDTVYGVERGREIYDPKSDAWYWLDACYDGAAAKNKEVWMPYVFQSDLESGKNKQGKWVRYDDKGKMIKGAFHSSKFWYYYDGWTGGMYHGKYAMTLDNNLIVSGVGVMTFDNTTGILMRKEGDRMVEQSFAEGFDAFSKIPEIKTFTYVVKKNGIFYYYTMPF